MPGVKKKKKKNPACKTSRGGGRKSDHGQKELEPRPFRLRKNNRGKKCHGGQATLAIPLNLLLHVENDSLRKS